MNIRAKKIKIIFDNKSEDSWEATCESGISFDDSMHMIARAWEEHDKPKEPLIKDEKIRKAIRAWADANDFSIFKVYNQHFNSCRIHGTSDRYSPNGSSIEFSGTIQGAEKICYDIDQLCGEEEE